MAKVKSRKKPEEPELVVPDTPAPDPPKVDPPKIVLTDKHALVDPKARKKVLCKVSLNLRTAGGGIVQLRQGKSVMVPALAVEDLRRSKLIH